MRGDSIILYEINFDIFLTIKYFILLITYILSSIYFLGNYNKSQIILII